MSMPLSNARPGRADQPGVEAGIEPLKGRFQIIRRQGTQTMPILGQREQFNMGRRHAFIVAVCRSSFASLFALRRPWPLVILWNEVANSSPLS